MLSIIRVPSLRSNRAVTKTLRLRSSGVNMNKFVFKKSCDRDKWVLSYSEPGRDSLCWDANETHEMSDQGTVRLKGGWVGKEMATE